MVENPYRGGNQGGDFAQVYQECVPVKFKQVKEALVRTRPGLVEEAMRNWFEAYGREAWKTLPLASQRPPN